MQCAKSALSRLSRVPSSSSSKQESGIKLTKEELEILLQELDSDGDGDINFSELATGHTEFKERTDTINTIITATQPRPLTT